MNLKKIRGICAINTIPWYLIVILGLLTSGLSLNANPSFVIDTTLAGNFLKKTADSYKIPGLAVAIVNDNGIIYKSGYEENSKGIRITAETPFLLGSTSKTFTALAIMRLVETGKVELDSPVKKYLPEFSLASPEYEDAITLRHLLNHTSGLSDKGMPYTPMGEKSLNDELILLKRCKPEAAPGVKFIYFNDNYRLLGLIIERVSGMKYGEFLYSEIFKPLGMKSSFAGPVGVKGLAEGHGEIFGFPIRRKQEYRAGALPSGFIASSAEDIGHFLAAELRAAKGDTGTLNPEIIKMTWQPPENIKGGYAMGWMLFDTIGETPFLGHGGSLENYQSFFYINPQLNLGFVFLMNQGGILPMVGGFGTLRNGLIKIMDGKKPESGSGSKPVFLVIGIFILILSLELYLTYRIKNLKKKMGQKNKWNVWGWIIADLVISAMLLIFICKGWTMIYNLLPELFFLILIAIVFGLIRSFIKIRHIL
jgi:CubicO group peptidase (beta-lactamase class C family)